MPRTIQADGRLITVPDDATPEEINNIVGPAQKQPPGFVSRLGEATGFPTSRAAVATAQPTMAEKIGGPAVTAGRMAYGYGRNLLSEGKQMARDMPTSSTGDFLQDFAKVNAPASRFINRGVFAPVGGVGVQNLSEDINKGNYGGAGGDLLGILVNLLMLRKSMSPSAKIATNRLTAAAGKDMLMPIEKTLPDLRKTASETGLSPKSMEDFHSVVSSASRQMKREADAALAPIGQTQIFPSGIAQRIRALITSNMVHTIGGQTNAAKIEAAAREFDRPWSYADLDLERADINKRINPFYNKEGIDQYAALVNRNTLIDKTIADAIRDIVYPQMDRAALKPPGYFRALKQRQGNLMELQSELDPKSPKSRTTALRGQTAEIQGGSRFSRENASIHMGGSGVPRASIYGLLNVIKKRNPMAAANKRVGMGFSTGSPTAKAYTRTLPMRQTLFPQPSEEEQR
jgi:hypothetical protein